METGLPFIIILVCFALVISAIIAKKYQFMLASASALLAVIIMASVSRSPVSSGSSTEGNFEVERKLEDYRSYIRKINRENSELSQQVREKEKIIVKLETTTRDGDLDKSLPSKELADSKLSEKDNQISEKEKPRSKKNGFSNLFGLIAGDDEVQDIIWEDKEANLKLVLKDSQVRKISTKVLNQEAVASWKYLGSMGYGLIIVENVNGLGLSTEDLNELTVTNLKSVVEEFKMVKKETLKTSAGVFNIIHCEATLKKQGLDYVLATLHHKGYYYQITSWTLSRDFRKADFIKKATEVAKGVQFLDPNKTAPRLNTQVVSNYRDENFGVEVSNPSSWEYYDLEQDRSTLPAYGATIKDESVLLYSIFAPSSLSDKDIFVAYNNLFSLSEEIPYHKLTTRKINGHTIESLTIDYDIEQGACHSKLELIRNGDRACVLRTWGWRADKLVDTDEFWQNFKWLNPEVKEIPEKFELDVKARSAKVCNQLALVEYRRGLYVKALKKFKRAWSLNRLNEDYVRNMIECHMQMGQNKEALKLTESVIKNSDKPSKEIQESYARILYGLGKLEDSSSAYQRYFFDGEYQDDIGMQNYLSLLMDQNKFDEAEKVADKYYKNFPSIKTQGWLGYMQFKNSNYEGAERTFEKILENQPKDEFALDAIIDLYIETKNMAKANARLGEWMKGMPDSIVAKLKKATVMKAFNKKSEAYDYLKSLSHEFPENQQIKTELAQMSSSLGLGDHALITRKIDPVSLNSKLQIELKNNKDIAGRLLEKDAINLHYISSIQIEKSGEVKETTRHKCRVLNPTGVKRHGKLQIEFHPTSQKIYVNSLKVYNKEGKVSYEGKLKDYYITDKNKDMATHGKVLHVPIKGLAVGSEYEITYTVQKWKYKDRITYDDYWFIQHDPTQICAVSLSGDLSGIGYFLSKPLDMIEDIETSKVWIEKNRLEYKSEGLKPNSRLLFTKLSIGSSTKSWKDVSKEYYNHVKMRISPSEEVKALARKIVDPKSKPEEQVQSVIQWVQSNITYQAIEFGPRGRMPKSSDQTLKTKEGDCKDMSLLLLHLLGEIGVEAHLALANSSDFITEQIPDEDQFNHIVIYCPDLPNKVIDPTSGYLNLLKYAPYSLTSNYILPVTAKGSELYFIPKSSRAEVVININRECSSDDTHIIVKETAKLEGFSASYYRRSLAGKNANQLSQYFTYVFNASYPQIEITKVTIDSDIQDNFTPLVVTIHSKISKEESNTKVPMLWESQYYYFSKIIDRRYPLHSDLMVTINSVNSFDKADSFKHAEFTLGDKYAQFSSKMSDGKLTILSTRKRCEGKPSEVETMRLQLSKIIPKITLP